MAGSLEMLLHDAKLLKEGGDEREMLIENMGDAKEAIVDAADEIEGLTAECMELTSENEGLCDLEMRFGLLRADNERLRAALEQIRELKLTYPLTAGDIAQKLAKAALKGADDG